jgi:hypothetical protein
VSQSIKRYNIYRVSGDQGWERRPSPKGKFIDATAHDIKVKNLIEVIRGLVIANNPDVQPAERHAIIVEACRVAGIPYQEKT